MMRIGGGLTRAVAASAVVAFGLAFGAPMLLAQQTEPALTWRDAVKVLAEERTFAESGAGLLKTYAKDDQAALIEGQKLYAGAKARFDGLIEQLLLDLAEDRNPEESPDMKVVVDAAVETRLAFSRHVEATLSDRQDGTPKNAWVDALAKGAGEIVAALIDGGIKIYQTYQEASAVRRETIATRVEQQRWRTFSEVEAAL